MNEQGSPEERAASGGELDRAPEEFSAKKKKKGNVVDILHGATRLLTIVSIGLFAYILANIFVIKPERSMPAESVSEESSSGVTPGKVILPEPKDFAEYAKIIQSRDIFNQPFDKAASRTRSTTRRPAGKKAALPPADQGENKNFKLVGIVLDRDPKAIIEDLRSKKTLFLSQGQQIGDVTLEGIEEGKVIITYKEQRIELTP